MKRPSRDEVRKTEVRFLQVVPAHIERVKHLIAYHTEELKNLRLNLRPLQETKKKFEARNGKQKGG